MSRRRPHHGNRRRPRGRHAARPRPTVEGKLVVTGSGHAQVVCAEGVFQVARRGMREAMGGDVVLVSLVPMHGKSQPPVAYVQQVMERAITTFLGVYEDADPLGVVVPLDARVSHDFFVLPEDESPRRLGVEFGDVVSACITQYPERGAAGTVTLDRRVGASDELDLGIESVISSYGLETSFPEDCLAEARGMEEGIEESLEHDPLRRDLTDEFCLTIDPSDARDFDDAVYGRRLEDGYEVSVHIADVSHYVTWASPIDMQARKRTCSVYLADRVLPMLPEELSCDICSLVPKERRLAMSVRIRLDRGGHVVSAEAFPSVIRSGARLAYEEADTILSDARDGLATSCAQEVRDTIVVLDEVAALRRKIRKQRGAIDFETREAKVILDETGAPCGVNVRMRTRATSLIEEAMLLANESVAKMLSEKDLMSCYRVHESPSPQDLKACVAPLVALGLMGSAEKERLMSADAQLIQRILAEASATGVDFVANSVLLRAQKRAVYAPHNEGHYALAAPAYCHFTSPIRRYPDLVCHRVLKSLLAGTMQSKPMRAQEKALPQLARTCSERERVADAASRDSTKVKMAEYYEGRIGEACAGIICGLVNHGLFVMLEETCAEGFLPLSALGEGPFRLDEELMRVVRESDGKSFSLGRHIAVKVASTNVRRGRIDLVLAKDAQKS